MANSQSNSQPRNPQGKQPKSDSPHSASAREEILSKLRTSLARPDLRFPPLITPMLTAETRMSVTRADGGLEELAERFGEELTALHGTYEIAETATEARLAMINRILTWIDQENAERKGAVVTTGQERSILAWSAGNLPVEHVDTSLEDLGLKLVVPTDLRSIESREKIRHIRYGVTGVEAAFAATGSMLMLAGPGTNRSASLLPFRHVALIPFSRLYRNFEEWLSEKRDAGTLVDAFRQRANLTLVSGPSKSADIEMALTLGVHGPKFVHAILFDDSPPDDDDQLRASDFFEEESDEVSFEEAAFEEDSFEDNMDDLGHQEIDNDGFEEESFNEEDAR